MKLFDFIVSIFVSEYGTVLLVHQICNFRTLRKLFKVDPADYMLSICGNDALRELSSPGKSGSFFYLTHDDRYMIKTMRKAEVKVSPVFSLSYLKLGFCSSVICA